MKRKPPNWCGKRIDVKSPFHKRKVASITLAPMGKDAYTLLLKAGTYDKLTLFQKKRFGATIGNAILWGIALLQPPT